MIPGSAEWKRWWLSISRQLSSIAGVLLIFLVVMASRTEVGWVRTLSDRVDNLFYDMRFAVAATLAPASAVSLASPPIVIVDIDEQSLRAVGRWPWSRRYMGDLVESLYASGAALIGFDVVFSEAENNPVQTLLAQGNGLSGNSRRELQGIVSRYDSDADFAARMGIGTVLGYFLHDDKTTHVGELPFPLIEIPPAQATLGISERLGYTSDLPVLMQGALGAGFLTTVPDDDGVIRRSPLVFEFGHSVYSSLALELARQYMQSGFVRPVMAEGVSPPVMEGLRLGDLYIPTDPTGAVLVPYRGKRGSFPYVSAIDVLQGKVPAAQLKNSIVLIGTSALGLADLRTTPLQTQYPGVEVHANILRAILDSQPATPQFPVRPDWEPGVTTVLLVFLGLLLLWGLPQLGPLWMLLAGAAGIVFVLASNLWFWQIQKLDLPLGPPLLIVILLTLLNIAVGFVRANSQKREIRDMFGQYVPAAHIDQMLDAPESVSFEGETREMTVLFSDVRSFTTISEGLSAVALKKLLNRYFTPITRLIFANGGTIDKYVGDMVMAFWGAPLADVRHAEHAIDAALAMLRELETLNVQFVAEGLPEIHIGIGINTGMMNVGDMGSSYRRAYTVLGDAVNLGSRLESVTKFYGVRILVGESTQAQASAYVYRMVDRIVVKGKTEPVRVYEPIARQEAMTPPMQERLMRYHQALEQYVAQQWDAADALFAELQQQEPAVKLYVLYRERIASLRQQVLPEVWDGVFVHTSK